MPKLGWDFATNKQIHGVLVRISSTTQAVSLALLVSPVRQPKSSGRFMEDGRHLLALVCALACRYDREMEQAIEEKNFNLNFNSISVLQSNFNQTSHCLVMQFICIALPPRNNPNAKSMCFLNQDRWRRDRVGSHDCIALLYNPGKIP